MPPKQNQSSAGAVRWLHPKAFGEKFGLSRACVAKLIAAGLLPSIRKPGLGRRIDAVAYEAELERDVRRKK